MIKIGFQKQPMMRKVLISLIPIFGAALYFYGINLLFHALVVFPLGIGLEYIFEKKKKKKVSEAVLVTCSLFLLSLPPQLPLWISAIGISFAVIMTKEVFGGFGRNPFNPAIAGRLFIYITFPGQMTKMGWTTAGNFGMDAVSSSTPLDMMRQGEIVNPLDLFLGDRAGSMGEGMILLILAAGIYLMMKKTASWRIIASTLVSALVLTLSLDLAGAPGAFDTLPAMLSGSFLFVTVFMATDPVSAPKKPGAQWLYGLVIGVCTVLVRTFSLFAEGTSFGILIGNTFAPLFDEFFAKGKKK